MNFGDNAGRVREILKAALDGDALRFKNLATVDATLLLASNARGSTALHLAAANNHMDIVKYIVRSAPSLLVACNSLQSIPCDVASDDAMRRYLENETAKYCKEGVERLSRGL